jgi:hypothetical protein
MPVCTAVKSGSLELLSASDVSQNKHFSSTNLRKLADTVKSLIDVNYNKGRHLTYSLSGI